MEGVGLVEMVSRGAVMNLEIDCEVSHPLGVKLLTGVN